MQAPFNNGESNGKELENELGSKVEMSWKVRFCMGVWGVERLEGIMVGRTMRILRGAKTLNPKP